MSESELQSALERIEGTLAKLARARARPPAEALTLRQAAAVLGIDRSRTLPALIRAGSIRTIDIAGHVRIPRREIDRVLEQGAPLTPQTAPRRQPHPRRSDADEVAAILAIPVGVRR